MIVKNYIGKCADTDKLFEFASDGGGDGNGGFITEWEIRLRQKRRETKDESAEWYALHVFTDMNGTMVGISRMYFSNYDDVYITRFPPDVEKRADTKLKKFIIPNVRNHTAETHNLSNVIGFFDGVAKARQSAKKKSMTAFRCGPYIFASSSSGMAILLAPIVMRIKDLAGMTEKQLSSLNVNEDWDGLYWVGMDKTGKGKSPKLSLRLLTPCHIELYAMKGLDLERISKLAGEIYDEYPAWVKVKKTTEKRKQKLQIDNTISVPRHAVGWERVYASASLDRVGWSVAHGFREGFDSLPSPKG